MSFRLRAPSDALLRRTLEDAREAEFSYPEVGATRTAELPDGYRIERHERYLGAADGRFERAVTALRRGKAQIGAGVDVYPTGALMETGNPVLLVARMLGLWAVLPCRVVYTVEDDSSFTFAYGTLPNHLESGEMAMGVERAAEGQVVARIVAFSKPVDPLARAVGPFAGRIQTRFKHRYLDALETASQPSISPSQRSASK
jgi:uncharacterized protein (UPF0548 family)